MAGTETMFLKLGDIKGEAQDSQHKEWIDIESIQAGVSLNVESGATGSKRIRGRSQVSDLSMTKNFDKASTLLEEACALGKPIGEAELHVTAMVKDKRDTVLKYKMKDVFVTSYSISGSDTSLFESFSLNYAEIEWIYCVFDDKGVKKSEVVKTYKVGPGTA
jgi:type VI secretion system secreted protein Hcp